jgi:2'-5' RNA ligase
MRTARLFIALPLPKHAASALADVACRMRQQIPGRFVKPEHYHLTLAFLGDTDLALLSSISGALEEISQRTSAIHSSFDSSGSFGNPQRAILWYGVSHTRPFYALAHEVRRACSFLGLSFDNKNFRPHLTLARQADIRNVSLASFSLSHSDILFHQLTLFESTREAGKLVYRPLHSFQLKPT